MCIRDRGETVRVQAKVTDPDGVASVTLETQVVEPGAYLEPVSYTHLRAHETVLDLVCRLLLEKKTEPASSPRTQDKTTIYTLLR